MKLSKWDRNLLESIRVGKATHKPFPFDTRRDGVSGQVEHPIIDRETGKEIGSLSDEAARVDLS